jgi:hypothetical protein
MASQDRWTNFPTATERARRTDRTAYAPDPRAGYESGREEQINDDRDRYMAAPEQSPGAWEEHRPPPLGPSSGNAFRGRPSEGDWRARTQPVSTPWSSAEQPSRRQSFAGKGPKGYVRSDVRLLEEVCDRLSADHSVDASEVTVTVNQAEVTLEGSVPDRQSKHRAEDVAASVQGVREVHNRLRAQKGLLQEIGAKIGGHERKAE